MHNVQELLTSGPQEGCRSKPALLTVRAVLRLSAIQKRVPQSGMLTLNKTHRLGGSYEPYTKVELFQLARLKLHWYLQYVDRNPPAGFGYRTQWKQSELLTAHHQPNLCALSSGWVPVAHLSFSACSVTAAPPSHSVCRDLKREGLFPASWKCIASCSPDPKIMHLSCDAFSDNLSKPFWMPSMV
ncbi:LOW QUALITY PROTEIN: hypothetical protein Nmel_014795 [Mimus melanotis]